MFQCRDCITVTQIGASHSSIPRGVLEKQNCDWSDRMVGPLSRSLCALLQIFWLSDCLTHVLLVSLLSRRCCVVFLLTSLPSFFHDQVFVGYKNMWRL